MDSAQEKLKNDPILKLWSDNFTANFKDGIFNRDNAKPINYIKNTRPYTNRPVILIAAGKSLDYEIDNIKNYKNNFIIICVDIVLYKLLENGIKPDFVVNIDPHELTYSYFYDLDTSDITLVCPTTGNNKALNDWKGNFVFFNQVDSGKFKNQILSKITKMTSGFGYFENRFFVGATAYQLANMLQASYILFCGYDFMFLEGEPYCSGIVKRRAEYENFKYKRDTNVEERTEVINNAEKSLAENINNVLTKKNLLLYSSTLQKLIGTNSKKCLSCSPDKIFNYIKVITIPEFVNSYAKDEIKKRKFSEFKITKKRKK